MDAASGPTSSAGKEERLLAALAALRAVTWAHATRGGGGDGTVASVPEQMLAGGRTDGPALKSP